MFFYQRKAAEVSEKKKYIKKKIYTFALCILEKKKTFSFGAII